MTDNHAKPNVIQRFEPGAFAATRAVSDLLLPSAIIDVLRRHLSGDWGVVCEEDKRANQDALRHGDRLLSKYEVVDSMGDLQRVYVITEADRSVTTILLVEEY